MSAALRMLAYGFFADQCDEYLRIGETTALECMKIFSFAVIQCFTKEYLGEPTSTDMERILAKNAKRGFPGMLGSLDCMHWNWKNCPAAWRGSYKNYKGYTSIVLEGIADHSGWFWHAFFGMSGTFNDVNVMNTSPVFDRVMQGNIPAMPYTVNSNTYRHHYYLCDAIYPKYSTIMKSVRDPRGGNEKRFAAFQEGCRKDIERSFEMLQARCGVIKRSAMAWSKEVVSNIMIACIILHNMITEDEQHVPPCDYLVLKNDQEVLNVRKKTKEEQEKNMTKRKMMECRYKEKVDGYAQLRSTTLHESLKKDLMDHIWRESILGNIHCTKD